MLPFYFHVLLPPPPTPPGKVSLSYKPTEDQFQEPLRFFSSCHWLKHVLGTFYLNVLLECASQHRRGYHHLPDTFLYSKGRQALLIWCFPLWE